MQEEIDFDDQIQLKVKKCQLIESNSEYFTNIRRCVTDQQKLSKSSLRMLQKYILSQKTKLAYDSFANLLVQTGYLLFSCKFYQVQLNIYPLSQYFRVEELSTKGKQKKFNPVLYYDIHNRRPQNMHYCKVLYDCYNYLLAALSEYEKLNQISDPTDNQHKVAVQLFTQEYGFLRGNIQLFNNKERQFFQCLEQTHLFRKYSILLQILNSSLLDFIKTNPKILAQFKQCKKKDVAMVSQWNSEKKKPKNDNQKLKKKQQEIEKNINYFFETIRAKQYTEDQIIIKSQKQSQVFRFRSQFIIQQKTYGNFYDSVVKINSGINVRVQEQKITVDKPPAKLNFQIEYSSQRNSICIKLLSYNIHVNVESSDFLLFQSNVLIFDTANINIQLTDIKQGQTQNRVPRKVLVFKGASCFNTKEPPLQKILFLMDITMISAKIYEPQLVSSKGGYLREAQKISIIEKKVNHYTKIFLNCAKKIYGQQ